MYDVIIIGAGPAGLTAAIYTKRANLKTLIIEKESIGGQISSSPVVENYPGYESISGSELSDNMFNQAMNLGVDFEAEEVLKIIDGDIKTVITSSSKYETKTIIIATGASHKMLGLENEKELIGKGIHFCATCDGTFYKNKKVAVIGGANSAVQNAIYLANICSKVYIIYRKDKLRCESKLIEDLNKEKNIEVIYNANLTKLIGNKLEKIEINISGEKRILEIDGVFISVGLIPNNKIAEELIDINENGYFISNDCTTNRDGIFVAGDVRDKSVRQLTTAVSDGTIAATYAINYINNK